MSNTRPTLIPIHKAPLLVAFFFLFGLSACNPSWITDPLSKYLKNKTGIEIKIEKISVRLHPLVLETTGIQMRYQKDPLSWEAKIPELQVALDWTLSWEGLPWPEVSIEKITINRPSVLVRIPAPRKEADWTAWLKKLPVLKQIEIKDLGGRVELGKMVFQLTPGTQIKASFAPDQGGTVQYQIKSLQGRWHPNGIRFDAESQGSFELSDLRDHPKWNGRVTLVSGNLSHNSTKVTQVSGTFSWRHQDHLLEITASPGRVQRIDWKSDRASFSGEGELSLSGTFQLQSNKIKGALLSGLQVKLEEMDFNFRHRNRRIKGLAGGEVRLQGPLLNPIFKARLSTRQTEMELPPVFTQGLETAFEVQGKFPSFSFPEVRARAAQTEWQSGKGPFLILNPDTLFSARIKTDTRQIYLNEINLKTANWSPLTGSLLFDLNKGSVPQGKARTGNFPLLKFIEHFFPKIREPFPEEIPCQGNIEWTREAAGAPIDFLVSIVPVPFSFQLPRTEWEGEELKARIQGSGKWFFKDKKVQLDLGHTLSGGTLSRSPWFFAFDQDPLTGRLEVTIDAGRQARSIIGSLGFRYAPLGDIKVFGEWPFGSSPRSYSGFIEVQNLPLEKGFPLLIGEPLSDDRPFLEKVSLQGRLQARLSIIKKEKIYDLQGRIRGSDIDLKVEDPAFIFQKGSLDLPFHLSSPNRNPDKKEFSELGFIQVENFQGFRMGLNKLRFSVLAGTNQFEIPDKIEVPLWGGQAILNSFRLTHFLEELKVDAAVSLQGLNLAELLPGQGIMGTLQIDLRPIRIDKENARMEGTLKAQVFEGTVEGKNWVIVHPFSPERVIRGDLFFNHLNLEPITQRFSFGKITGFVQGRVTDLVVRHNLPERFYLQVNTQEIPGVPKRINIKAIENIGLLGTGWGELDVLRKGINRFISEYAYREIGLSCNLQDNFFTLRGMIFENGIEYLVRKPGFFGIDVINKNPDNEILFSDIMERIRSIGKKPQKGTGDES
ncbi:MAG: hypothetical protein HY787_16285 [Deltaproteobacteria bacterium]|nr:hypothetical protein [Deltaproteobacteria bacterium]